MPRPDHDLRFWLEHMREISANDTDFRSPEVEGHGISGTYDRHEPRSTRRVLRATACQLSDLASVLRDLVRDHAREFLGQARFSDGAAYHRELLRAAPELLAASRPLHAVLRSTRRPLDRWPETFELWLLSWLPGQVTPIHDHGGAVTVTTVLSGAVLEERFERVHGTQVRPTWTTLREVGDIDPIEPTTIHRVRPVGSAVTLHLYVPACVDGRTYEAVSDDLRSVRSA